MAYATILKMHKWRVMTLDSQRLRACTKYLILRPMQWQIWTALSVTKHNTLKQMYKMRPSAG